MAYGCTRARLDPVHAPALESAADSQVLSTFVMSHGRFSLPLYRYRLSTALYRRCLISARKPILSPPPEPLLCSFELLTVSTTPTNVQPIPSKECGVKAGVSEPQ